MRALKRVGKRARGAVLFVTLEPCSHQGKTPPCVDAVIRYGINRVYIGALDPNPLQNVSGRAILRKNGIRCDTGILGEECREQIKGFLKVQRQARPYVTFKVAQSLDGKIATIKGDSKWISSPGSRRMVHALRKKVDAVAIGSRSAIIDNPFLSVRKSKRTLKRQPAKIIFDSTLKVSLANNVFDKERSPGRVIVVCTENASPKKKSNKGL